MDFNNQQLIPYNTPYKSLLPLNPPDICHRESPLQRDAEKQRIREAIIAQEFIRRRQLEAEVRQELAVEREFGGGFSTLIRSEPSIPQPSRALPNHKKDTKRERRKLGDVENCDCCCCLCACRSVKRRKREEKFPRSDAKTVWRCGLCNVTATSKKSLDGHFLGKKHRTAEETMGKKNEAISFDLDPKS